MTRIYLSSTYSDLKDYREAVHRHLCKMTGVQCSAMEDYVATDQRPVDKCLADVKSCDVYVGLFAHRYGFVPTEDNPEGKSITELEYRQAVEDGKQILIFLMAEDAPWPPVHTDYLTGEGDKGRLIQSLRKELSREKIVSFFHSSDNLASLVSIAVSNLVNHYRLAPVASWPCCSRY